jgi:cell division protein ZipA
MNELQQVLLVFAVVVIAVLYFLSKRRQTKHHSPENTGTARHTSASKTEASNALNELGNSHPALSSQTETRLQLQGENEDNVPENQASLPFEEEFAPSQHTAAVTSDDQTMEEGEKHLGDIDLDRPHHPTRKQPRHHVLHVDELYTLDELGQPGESQPRVNFGIPKEQEGVSPGISKGEKTEPQIFALLVLSTGGSGQEFPMDAVNQALLGVGLSFTSNQIYATRDSKGKEIIRAANILEPGTFPAENLHSCTTPGIALILQLPTSVRAPAAMHDLIMMARKVSQRLNGRLYNMERHLIKESDLQAMREAAVEYESEPLK